MPPTTSKYGARRTSLTRIQAFELCPRKWWNEQVLGRRTTTKAQREGTRLHKEEEDYLLTGAAMTSGPALAVLPYLPPTKIEAPELYESGLVRVESSFSLVLPNSGGIELVGTRDLVEVLAAGPRVSDYKFLSDLKWAKTAASLRHDTQIKGYAWTLAVEFGLPESHPVPCRHLSSQKKAPFSCIPAEVDIPAGELYAFAETLGATAREMAPYWEATDPAAIPVPDGAPDAPACSKYGGCPFQMECRILSGRSLFAGIATARAPRHNRPTQPKQETPMPPNPHPLTSFRQLTPDDQAFSLRLSGQPSVEALAASPVAPYAEEAAARWLTYPTALDLEYTIHCTPPDVLTTLTCQDADGRSVALAMLDARRASPDVRNSAAAALGSVGRPILAVPKAPQTNAAAPTIASEPPPAVNPYAKNETRQTAAQGPQNAFGVSGPAVDPAEATNPPDAAPNGPPVKPDPKEVPVHKAGVGVGKKGGEDLRDAMGLEEIPTPAQIVAWERDPKNQSLLTVKGFSPAKLAKIHTFVTEGAEDAPAPTPAVAHAPTPTAAPQLYIGAETVPVQADAFAASPADLEDLARREQALASVDLHGVPDPEDTARRLVDALSALEHAEETIRALRERPAAPEGVKGFFLFVDCAEPSVPPNCPAPAPIIRLEDLIAHHAPAVCAEYNVGHHEAANYSSGGALVAGLVAASVRKLPPGAWLFARTGTKTAAAAVEALAPLAVAVVRGAR